MNPVIQSLYERRSVRSFTDAAVPPAVRQQLLDAAAQAPTAGNQQLYAILDIQDPGLKASLAEACDHQPFIASAPLVFVFLADCQRWLDSYRLAGIEARPPELGDLLLACEDAVIAAQNMVMAAEALGLGSCYIGDILENQGLVSDLLGLEGYVLPITMLVLGYPTEQQRARPKPERFPGRFLVHTNRYRRLTAMELRTMFSERQVGADFDYQEYITAFCRRKYLSEFAAEMNRSVAAYLQPYWPVRPAATTPEAED